MARWILSFGDQAEALAPGELREQVRREAEGIVKMHGAKRS
jgi:predicted DNA-binding transcriptional regulator YafY